MVSEMIFGFTLAVIAGYISGPMKKRDTFAWMALWLAAAASFWLAPTHWISAVINVFCCVVGTQTCAYFPANGQNGVINRSGLF